MIVLFYKPCHMPLFRKYFKRHFQSYSHMSIALAAWRFSISLVFGCVINFSWSFPSSMAGEITPDNLIMSFFRSIFTNCKAVSFSVLFVEHRQVKGSTSSSSNTVFKSRFNMLGDYTWELRRSFFWMTKLNCKWQESKLFIALRVVQLSILLEGWQPH